MVGITISNGWRLVHAVEIQAPIRWNMQPNSNADFYKQGEHEMEMTSYEPGTPCWVDIGSPDPNAAAEFYGTLFGWEFNDMGTDAGNYKIATLKGKSVAGIGEQQNKDMPPYWTMSISTDDVDTTVKAVTEAGGQVLATMDVMDAGRLAVFADTAGASFSAWQPNNHIGANLVNEPGTFCWNELQTRQPAEEAKAFYTSVFPWEAETKAGGTGMGPSEYTEWKVAGRSIGGMIGIDENWPAEVPNNWSTYFAVEDTDAAIEKVVELGGSVRMPATDIPIGRFAFVADPDGAVFGLIKLNQG